MPLLHRLLAAALVSATLGCSDDKSTAEPEPDAGKPCESEPVVRTTDSGETFVRTPDACFEHLPNWPYEARYVEIDGLRQAYIDEGPSDGEIVLLLHGQPSWSYLYRKMIPGLTSAGYRVIAMDHLGMGRSDKPIELESHSYLRHSDRLEQFIEALGLREVTVFVQDWGSTIGLRIVGLHPEWFARVVAADGDMPVYPPGQLFPPVENPDEVVDMPSLFTDIPAQMEPVYEGCEPLVATEPGFFGVWIEYCLKAASFKPSEVVEAITWFDVPTDEEAAYDAPYPSRIYMTGPRVFPSLVNDMGGQTEEAWAGLEAFDKPFLTLWAGNDAGVLGACETQDNLICSIPGGQGQPHARLFEASHFVQDDQGEELARRMIAWMNGDETVAGNHVAECEAPATLPITADGTGTPCTTDADCTGLEADLCVTDGTASGFCTVEGCAPAECGEPYVCCGDCSEDAASLLPFEESACFPEAVASQLESGAGCSCH